MVLHLASSSVNQIFTAARAALASAGASCDGSATTHRTRLYLLHAVMLEVYIAAQHVLEGVSVF
jgi:hypothetical protein